MRLISGLNPGPDRDHIRGRPARFPRLFRAGRGFRAQPLYRTVVAPDGKVYPDAAALNLLRPDRLREFLAAVREEPDDWGGKRARATAGSGPDRANCCSGTIRSPVRRSYRSLRYRNCEGRSEQRSKENPFLLYRIRQHAPLTISGMMILARGIMLFEERQRE